MGQVSVQAHRTSSIQVGRRESRTRRVTYLSSDALSYLRTGKLDFSPERGAGSGSVTKFMGSWDLKSKVPCPAPAGSVVKLRKEPGSAAARLACFQVPVPECPG